MRNSFIKKLLIISMLFLLNLVYATTVKSLAYIKTSGTQMVNTTDQKVNDVVICPTGNEPGCDTSHDTKFTKKDTGNVYESGNNMIVRTGDSFEVDVEVSANGGDVDEFTITSTLPSSYLKWNELPSVCKEGSTISDNGLSMSCLRKDLKSGQTETIPFSILVKQSAPHNTDLDKFTFEVKGDGFDLTPDTDTDISGDNDRLIITASPRWNLDLRVKPVEQDYNKSGEMGYLVKLPFSLEMDRVYGAIDNIDSYIGSEQLGEHFTLNANVEINSTSSSNNAEIIQCIGQDTIYNSVSNGYPIGYYNTNAPHRSVATPKDVATISCLQNNPGDDIAIEYKDINASMEHFPIETRETRSIPTYRRFAAIGELQVFVPYSDLKETEEKTDEDGDKYYDVNITVGLKDFDPTSISGFSNFGEKSESLKDNVQTVNFKYYPDGKAIEAFKKGFSKDRFIIGQTVVFSFNWENKGSKDFNNSKVCDVIDVNTYKIRNYGGASIPYVVPSDDEDTLQEGDFTVKYGVGYERGSWPPPLDENNSQAILDECTKTEHTTWYSDYDEAVENGPITKIMVETTNLKKGKTLNVRFWATAQLKRTDNYNDKDYTINKLNEILPNYTARYDDVMFARDDDHWKPSEIILAVPDGKCDGAVVGGTADRACLDLADVSIDASLSKSTIEYKESFDVSLHSAYTTMEGNATIEDNVTVVAVLPKGFSYKVGSSTLGDPIIGTCEDIEEYYDVTPRRGCNANPDNYQVLVWNFGKVKTGDPLPDINYTVNVDVRAKEGRRKIYAQIAAPETVGTHIKERFKAPIITVAVPKKFYISKRVVTPFRNIDESPITFVTDTLNMTDDAISNIDIIDILPFNGDGTSGFDFEDDKHLRDESTSYHGTLSLDSVEALEACSGSVTWEYTNKDPKEINLSPKHTSNLAGGTTSWCEGDESGPDSSCGFDKSEVTAVRMKYADSLNSKEMCSLKLNLKPEGNQYGDIYTNTSGGAAKELSLPVMSNDVSAIVPTTGIGDFVWLDANQNGIQDANEKGVKEITLKLLDADGNEVATATTDKNGYYMFKGLAPDIYSVKIDLPTDSIYSLTTKDAGDDDALDSDADDNNFTTAAKEIKNNEVYRDFDFGLTADIEIAGKVFDDGDGATIDGDAINVVDGSQLYITLLDSENNIVASKELSSSGEYLFSDADGLVPDSNYTLVLSIEANSTTAKLPDNWEFTAENNGSANDSAADGKVVINLMQENISNINFGINKKPEAFDINATSQVNPGGPNKVAVPDLNGSDNESALSDLVFKVTSLPDNAKLYCDGVEITTNDLNKTCAYNKLELDPNDGELNATFKYVAADPAGAVSNEATVFMPFTDLTISGHIYDDGDGDSDVDGTPISAADETELYVNLVDSSDSVVAWAKVDSNGSYSFSVSDGLEANKDYTLVLSTQTNSTTAKLPDGWSFTGEKVGDSNDGDSDGKVDVSLQEQNINNIDFGINKKPEAFDINATSQVNPGGDNKVAVPDLNGSDKESALSDLVFKITSLPTNAKLYCNGTEIKEEDLNKTCAPNGLEVDPANGDVNVTFKYVAQDPAGAVSDEATVLMPFTNLTIGGSLYDDGDGSEINGTKVSQLDGQKLYVSLLDKNGNLIASKELESSGNYSFPIDDGLEPNKEYNLVLAKDINSTTASLPENWIHTAEAVENSNDAVADGVIDVNVSEQNIGTIYFGVDKIPTAKDINATTKVNPGGDNKEAVPTLEGNDSETPNSLTFKVTSLPDNGKLYCDGVEITINDLNKTCAPDKLEVNPDDGDLNVTFKYVSVDAAKAQSKEATVVVPFRTLLIVGKIYDDGDGSDINGTPIAKVDDTQLYVTLVKDGTILASKAVGSDGSYIFDGGNGVREDSNYTIVLSTEANATESKLPAQWEFVGESNGSVNDRIIDGVVALKVLNEDVAKVDFAIDKKPVAKDITDKIKINPGKENKEKVPTLEGNDKETPNKLLFQIISLPLNAKLYCNEIEIKESDLNKSCEPNKLSVDPQDGEQNVTFKYITLDAAGIKSKEAKVVIPFSELIVGGKVYDDGNGDGNINGKPIGKIDNNSLYINLIDKHENIVASVLVSNDGSYTFKTANGLEANKTYKLVLSTDANTTVATLPDNWNNADGEKSENNTSNGNDGNADGVLYLDVKDANVVNNDFGVNKKPEAKDVNESLQKNPGGEQQVQVPTLDVSDLEDTTPTTIVIKELPTKGVLYYDGTKLNKGDVITNYEPKKLTLDPDNGAVTVEFSYAAKDRVGVESESAKVLMPFDTLVVSGHIFDDRDENGNVDGNLMTFKPSGTQLYVNLVDENGDVLSSKPVSTTGMYGFGTTDGVEMNTTFKVVLSIEANSSSASLPVDWENKDGEKSQNTKTNGTDGSADGIVEVVVKEDSVENNDFALRHIQTCLGNRVWLDKNGNGIQDANEEGIKDVTVTLLDKDGANSVLNAYGVKVEPQVTKEDGLYHFCDLVPNKYTVAFKAQADEQGTPYISTAQNQGDESVDSDIPSYKLDGGISDVVELKAGDDNNNTDAGFIQELCLGDFVWEDTNANGIYENGEKPLAGVKVTLLVKDGDKWIGAKDVQGNTIAAIETNSTGGYKFCHLKPAQDYKIVFTKPEGYYVTSANVGDDTKDSDVNTQGEIVVTSPTQDNMTLDAGFFKAACLGDRVWLDSNANGIQDKGESSIAGAIVTIYEADGSSVAKTLDGKDAIATTTSSESNYHICNLRPGKYVVGVSKEDGTQYYFTRAGSQEDKDRENSNSDSNIKEELKVAQNGKSVVIELSSGEDDRSWDAGMFESACIGDYIWEDANANGIQDKNEQGIKGISVTLEPKEDIYGNINSKDLKDLSLPREVFTDKNGYYEFCNLIPGTYQVKVEVPENYYVTRRDVNSTDDSKDSDMGAFLDTNKEVTMPEETLSSGERNMSFDGGMFKAACLKSKAYLDKNGNNVYDERIDEPLEGVKVTIVPLEDEYGNKNEITIFKEQLGSIITNANGEYKFCSLIPGRYKFKFERNSIDKIPAFTIINNENITTKGEDIKIGSGKNTLILAGFVEEVCLGGRVWYDKNLNGIQDEGADYGVIDVVVKLFMEDDNGKWITKATTKTDKKGKYKFCDNVKLGESYKVAFTLPEGYNTTFQNKGDDTKDSDGNKEAEIIIAKLENKGAKDKIAGDYTQDIGIYCDCNDFKAHPEEYKEVKAPALNIAGAALLLLTLWMASFARRDQN